jgi:hypothetical protein
MVLITYIGMVALEIIIAAPLALLMIGYDSLSIQIGYLALVLATLSQVSQLRSVYNTSIFNILIMPVRFLRGLYGGIGRT